MILGVSRALSEAEVHWREFLVSLKERGIGIPSLIVSDAHTGLKAALRAACNASPWQRCQFHLQQNAGHLVTKQELKSIIASQIAAIFNAESRPHAEERLRVFLETWREKQPKLVAWAEENLPEGFTVFDLPEAHRRKLRTSNACENSRGMQRESDFLILGPAGGLLALEVKSSLPRHFPETGRWEGAGGDEPIAAVLLPHQPRINRHGGQFHVSYKQDLDAFAELLMPNSHFRSPSSFCPPHYCDATNPVPTPGSAMRPKVGALKMHSTLT